MMRSFIWLREVGVLLLMSSLFFLPWFRDPAPPEGRSAIITGTEFLLYRVWPVILAYTSVLLAYGVSKFSEKKWGALIFLTFACMPFLYIHVAHGLIGDRADVPFIPLNREHPYSDVRFAVMDGMWVNWIGLLALAIGIFLAETGRGRRIFTFAGWGAIVGLIVLVCSAWSGITLPEIYGRLGTQLFGFANESDIVFATLLWLQLFMIPLAGAVIGTWVAFRDPQLREG